MTDTQKEGKGIIEVTQELEKQYPVPAPQNTISLSEAHGIAKVFMDSGLFSDTKSLAQATVKVMAGYELGIGPFAAMRNINIIQGQLAPNAAITAALIKRDPDYDYRVVKSTKAECEIKFYHKGTEIGTTTWDMQDAALANLTNKSNWKAYPRDMLFARCLTQGARQHCPQIFMGSVYVPEELGDDNENYIVPHQLESVDVSDGVVVATHTPPNMTGEEAAIDWARETIKNGKFPPNEYLPFAVKLGFDETYAVEVKNDCKDAEEPFTCAVTRLVDEYRKINS